jgi:hypothetical protein
MTRAGHQTQRVGGFLAHCHSLPSLTLHGCLVPSGTLLRSNGSLGCFGCLESNARVEGRHSWCPEWVSRIWGMLTPAFGDSRREKVLSFQGAANVPKGDNFRKQSSMKSGKRSSRSESSGEPPAPAVLWLKDSTAKVRQQAMHRGISSEAPPGREAGKGRCQKPAA